MLKLLGISVPAESFEQVGALSTSAMKVWRCIAWQIRGRGKNLMIDRQVRDKVQVPSVAGLLWCKILRYIRLIAVHGLRVLVQHEGMSNMEAGADLYWPNRTGTSAETLIQTWKKLWGQPWLRTWLI